MPGAKAAAAKPDPAKPGVRMLTIQIPNPNYDANADFGPNSNPFIDKRVPEDSDEAREFMARKATDTGPYGNDVATPPAILSVAPGDKWKIKGWETQEKCKNKQGEDMYDYKAGRCNKTEMKFSSAVEVEKKKKKGVFGMRDGGNWGGKKQKEKPLVYAHMYDDSWAWVPAEDLEKIFPIKERD